MPIVTFSAIRPSAVVIGGLCALLLVLSGCTQREGAEGPTDTETRDTATISIDTSAVSNESIYDVLRGDDRFTTFVTAVDSADLDQTLSGPGPFTVFAPANHAFDRADPDIQDLLRDENEDELRDLLLSHISNGEKMASSLQGTSIRSLAGGDLDVTGSGDSLRVGDATIVEADIEAANGVIHAVAQLLVPSMDEVDL